jgi:DNA-binding response OmpR family regulator
MFNQALYLTSEAHVDETILNLLRTHCAEVHVVSAVAQATALIFPSTLLSSSSSRLLIVADVAAGGLALAEYVAGILNRDAQLEEQPTASSSPARIVLIDEAGDVNAARKALRLGVDEYLLASDSMEARLNTIRALIVETDPHEAGDPSHESNSAMQSAGEDDAHALYAPDGLAYSLGSGALDNVRLSQIEAAIINCLSAHTGLPLSARAIVNQVMGRDMDEDKAASLIRPHISRLRSKVEPMPQMPQRLLTVRGKGYMFVC